MKAARLLSVLLLVATAIAAVQDKEYDLLWKPKKDDVLDYAMSMEITVDDTTAKFTSEMRLKVLDVESNGDYEVETTIKNMKAIFDGEEEALEDEEPKVEKFNAKGEKISKKDDEDEEESSADPISRALDSIVDAVTDKKVKKGGKWEKEIKGDEDKGFAPAKVEYELVGEENVERWDGIRIKFTYKETEGDKPVTGEGSFWLDPKNFALLRFDADLENISFGEEVPPGKAKMRLVRQ